ncbi:MAG: DUF1573 domain-containing protein [Phycisphaerae bacterium]|jgi:hypothetical protein
MKRDCSIITILIVASVCFLQISRAVAAEESKPGLTATETAAGSAKDQNTADVKGKPVIVFENVVYDFGNIAPSSKNVCEFKFTNKGDSLLNITDVSKTCGCTPYTLEKKEYEPNETGTLKVEYNASSQTGSVRKTLHVSSNDQANPRVELVITAEVVSKISFLPKKLDLVLNKENAGCPAITIKSLDGQPFSIKEFKAIGQLKPLEKAITADFNSPVKATEFVIQPKVDVKKLREESGGRIEITLTHPESPMISIPFEVLPMFKVTPPSIIVYKADLEKSVTREVWVINNYDDEFEIESTSSQEGTIKVLSQEKVENNRYKFELEITPPAGGKGPRGYFTDTFFVNIKGGEKLKIACRMFYSKKAEKSPPVTEKSPPDIEKSPSSD